MTDIQKIFLQLVRLGIGHEPVDGSRLTVHGSVDWEAVLALAERQVLSAVVADGIDWLKVHGEGLTVTLPPQPVMLQLIGSVLQNYEYRYELYRRAIAELAGFYNSHGFKMMVLKGFACALDWPKPEHRPSGDIDIWLFGQQKEADAVLSHTDITDNTEKDACSSKSDKNLYRRQIEIDNSHHHHTVFDWCGFSVENHYDFVNVYAHKSSAELEKVFKELGTDDSHSVEVLGEEVYVPSSNLHALFLIRHMVSHFAAAEITLRQVLDWAFFVEKHTKEVDWNWLVNLLDKYHMKDFFNLINAICVEDLGFPIGIFPEVRFVPELKERVLEDILDPKYTAAEPKGFIPRVIFKYKRWQGNAWKQEMCYGESRWSAFWSGIWAKILKPASI